MENCLRLSGFSHTPVSYWLEMPVTKLEDWLRVAVSMKKKEVS